MNNLTQTDVWIYHTMIVLSLIAVVSATILTIIGRPLPEILIAVEAVAAGGLARLVVPACLNRK